MVKAKDEPRSDDVQVEPPVIVTSASSNHPTTQQQQRQSLTVEVNSGTPPPSRDPSPPPSPALSVPKSHATGSNWTIEIEELSDEPPPARQAAKDKGSLRDRRRSSSWSRSFMNSFRRKKVNESTPADGVAGGGGEIVEKNQESKPAATKPISKKTKKAVKSSAAVDHETDESEVEADSIQSVEEESVAEPVPDVAALAAETKSISSSSQTKKRLSRILSFGTLGRRKSMPPTSPTDDQITVQSDNKDTGKSTHADSKAGKRRESKLEAKQIKATSKDKSVDDSQKERVELQPEAKSKRWKSSDKATKVRSSAKEVSTNLQEIETDPRPNPTTMSDQTATGINETDQTQSLERPKSKQKFFTMKVFSKSVDIPPKVDSEQVVVVAQPAPVPDEDTSKSVPVGVKPKRRALSTFFKRDRTSKEIEESFDAESPAPEMTHLKKGGRLRNSFGRRHKVKSTEIEATTNEQEEVTAPVATMERNKKPRRSTSMVFGSSFSLKKMFGAEPQITEPTEATDKIGPTVVTKRAKGQLGSSTPRAKSVQLEEKENHLTGDSQDGNLNSVAKPTRNTIGERFISFTRDSWRLKKRQRSVSNDHVTIDHDALNQAKADGHDTVDHAAKEEPEDIKEEDNNMPTPSIVDNEANDQPMADVETNKATQLELTQATLYSLAVCTKPFLVHYLISSFVLSVSCVSLVVVASPSSSSSSSREGQSTAVDVQQAKVVPADQLASLQELVKVPISPGYLQSDFLLVEALGEILVQLKSSSSSEATQLRQFLENPHFKALLKTHDTVKDFLKSEVSEITDEFIEVSLDRLSTTDEWKMPADISAVRVVGIRKNPGEPLGLTVKTEEGQLVIARILAGGAVDRQGLLHVGDIIGEVNGIAVRSAEQLQVEIARCREHIQLKILPSMQENGSNGAQCCVRAHFDYDPKEDKLLPCPEIGLAFKKGDILQVVNQSDPNWWQAKKVGWSGPAGLIPSQELEERRKAFVAPEADFVHKIGFCGTRISKKKKKLMYQIKSSVDLDKAELLLYEEVTRMPPFRRKTLVLVGSEGIGRRTLKNRLINSDPDRFGTTMPHTSRPMRELEEDGMGYWFVSREEMEHDVRDHQFLEFGEHNGHLYGTKLDTIRAVIRQGKMCVLDCSPNALKTLHNSPEFMPYVIFLAAPGMEQLKSIYENARYSSRNLGTFDRSSSIRFSSRRARTLESLTSLYEEEDFKNALEESARIQRIYEKYFDQIIINEDPDQTFRKVVEALEILSNQHQWVPVSWVY
uniref:EOG090X032R n=1 Tax=Scapholeberis mucronata TaxID=202097 RepID=A0A4Y7NLN3_9CRUS|nr:EOG090X032R [Scapholeberis mucronata]SVE93514.1 EOG090X032R [Scapholeberis mucronata]